MNIVFSINELGLEGLGPTVTSLVRNCSDNRQLNLFFLCSNLSDEHKSNIQQLLKTEKFEGKTSYMDFDAKAHFGNLKSLHGDWSTYGRLLIPTFINDETALYLDADLIILTDVLELKNFRFTDNVFAAVNSSTVEWALEKDFFLKKLNWTPDTPYFNAGVLFFNIKNWKANDVDKKLKVIGDKYPDEFLSADQTLLNAYCQGKFDYLPAKFNAPWYPGTEKPKDAEDVILHFVGSPKPWDILGRTIHKGYKTWNEYNTTFWNNSYGKMSMQKLKRTWEIRRSLFRNLKKKLSAG